VNVKAPTTADKDVVDGWIEKCVVDLPELDPEVEGLVDRIYLLNKQLRKSLEQTLVGFGLSYGEWGVLGKLRSAGPPYRRSPGELAELSQLSSGAMTNRLDRLERAGFVRRLPDPNDRRGIQVELTDDGLRIWRESVGVQAAKEEFIASALDQAEKEQLNMLLRRLVNAFEHNPGALPPAET
jgi:DNA-binding MarR family transcriptional regulator